MNDILHADNLTKQYQNKTALDHFSVNLPAGRIIGLLGPNGSGKTTFMKLAAGLLTATSGSITIDADAIGVTTKAKIAYLPDRLCFNRERKVREQLDYFQDFYPDFDRPRAEAMLNELKIDPNAKFKTLSLGNQEKAQLVMTMARRAKLYLLDEPIGGVDPAARDYILDTILCNYNPEATVVISTHLIADVERILDDVLFLKDGKLFLQGNADEIREQHNCSLDQLFREVFTCSANS